MVWLEGQAPLAGAQRQRLARAAPRHSRLPPLLALGDDESEQARTACARARRPADSASL